MRLAARPLLALPLGLGFAACDLDPTVTIKGTGPVVNELREVEAFDAIAVVGALDVAVQVGPAAGVRIEGHENLIEHVDAVVSGATLRLQVASGVRLVPPPAVAVTLPSIAGVDLAGSGSVRVDGVDSPRLVVQLEGSGDVQARGRVDELQLAMAGSGDADLLDLAAGAVEVGKAGSGDARVWALRALVVEVAGSGDVTYRGEPGTLQVDAQGTAEVRAVATASGER